MSDVKLVDDDSSREIRLCMTVDNIQILSSDANGDEAEEGEE